MGIHGLLRELGPAPRLSLAKLAADHHTTTDRPLRLAIDVQIWLFQIQSGKGGSNPALRTFYYRLLRLLSLNIWPLFVFDGPNKPLFKRNKKVGGQGVRVATVPEFLAKQLLKEFGFPWHVAPGEAEAECALLQREGVVDAVLSEDVDTLMFGSGLTLRNWTSENSTKSPTHVSVYREQETMERSRGVDREGMILVALMSGGDYLPEGIPGCGPKVACDAARAGFGKELCALRKGDTAGMESWKERLQHQIRTNEAKHFSRKTPTFTLPADFPNREVLGYYTHPCVSTPEKVARLKESLKWDQPIDFPALRSFAADAFDWRCRGGAKKFIKNLAPALLVRELRRQGVENERLGLNEKEQEVVERKMVRAIHGKRNHGSVDGELELRISFIPAAIVPIDLSLEEEDDDFIPAGGVQESETESELAPALPPSSAATQAENDDDEEEDAPPTSPAKKKRQPRPFDPDQPEKVWILRQYLQLGCPLLVEEYEASLRDPKEFLKLRRKAKAVGGKVGVGNVHAGAAGAGKRTGAGAGGRKGKGRGGERSGDALRDFVRVSKVGKEVTGTGAGLEKEKEKGRTVLGESSSQGNEQRPAGTDEEISDKPLPTARFKVFSTQIPDSFLQQKKKNKDPPTKAPATKPINRAPPTPSDADKEEEEGEVDILDLSLSLTPRPFARFAATQPLAPAPPKSPAAALKRAARLHQAKQLAASSQLQKTPPRRKRRSAELESPARSQRSLTEWYSPSPRKSRPPLGLGRVGLGKEAEVVDLVSSSPAPVPVFAPPDLRRTFVRSPSPGLRAGAGGTAAGGSLFVSPVVAREDPFETTRLPDTVTKRRRKGPLRRFHTAPVFGEDDNEEGQLTPRAERGDDSVWLGERAGAVELEAMDLAAPGPLGGAPDELEGGWGSDGDEDAEDLPSPHSFLPSRVFTKTKGNVQPAGSRQAEAEYPTPPTTADGLPRTHLQVDSVSTASRHLGKNTTTPTPIPDAALQGPVNPTPRPAKVPAVRRSPRHQTPINPPAPSQTHTQPQPSIIQKKKKAFLLRQSLEGAWKEVDAETLDLSGDGSGWKVSGGRAGIVASSWDGAVGGRRGGGKGRRAWRGSRVEVLDLTGA